VIHPEVIQPGASAEPRRAPLVRAAVIVGWLVLALPALYQLVLLVTAIAGRAGYPYDLEWMEGGLLVHARRLADGHGLYPPPSIDFIPYLYTPLYPALLALLGKLFGLSYALGRAISIVSLLGIAAIAATTIAAPRFRHVSRAPAWCGLVLGLGLFAAIYPYVEGWYDLVRADTLFVFLATAGLAAIAAWAIPDGGWRSHARAAGASAILVLAFFTKQTAVFYIPLGGAIALVQAPRRAATFTLVAAVLGIGICALANAVTDGWFWVYVSKVHRAHDFNMDRFWGAYGDILWHFPALTVVVVTTLFLVGYTWLRSRTAGGRRELPRQVRPFLLWTSAFVVSLVVGAIGIGTEWSHKNAYIPAFLHGGLAAGAAVPALAACTSILWANRPRTWLVANGVAAVAALALAAQLALATWAPARFVPMPSDRAAGDRLIARLRSIDGEVWMPSHPWYLVLAGKQPFVHRMGIKDVTWRQTRTVAGLAEALRDHRFSALVLDDRDLFVELPIAASYRPALKLPADERPRVFTGALVVPDTIWLPATPAHPPPNAQVISDFELALWTSAGWTRAGTAWGPGPATDALPGQDLVIGATGMRFATSMHGGQAAVGRVTSPAFALDGNRLAMKLGGGCDADKLRVELWVDGAMARSASVSPPCGDTLREVDLDVSDLRGKQATLVLVDDSTTGHLDVDDVWLLD
jgi:hypothetical protein